MNTANIVIMAAGHGKRMGADRPKPLVELEGKPMVQYILDAVKQSGVCEKPTIVVSSDNINLFKEIIGDSYQFAIQEKQLGTGHAVQSACPLIDKTKPTIVLNGDHPTISAEMLQNLVGQHVKYNAAVTIGVVTVPSFDDWYVAFENWGRITRNDKGRVTQIVEAKDATLEQLNICEVNPNYLCFDSGWMCNRLTKVTNDNAQEEYYLTDLIKMAVAEEQTIASSPVSPEEGVGVNTPEQLEIAKKIITEQKS